MPTYRHGSSPSERFPLVSIITPTLNRAHFLDGMLASVSAQTYPAIEHIVIDGGSSDDTRAVLKRWEGRHNLRWISEPDRGMYSAVNKGLRLARGEVLAYLNSDDRYFRWSVEAAVGALERLPEASFIFGDNITFDLDTGVIELHLFAPLRMSYLTTVGCLSQPTVFWRRSAMDGVGLFDERLSLVADCDYWIRLARRARGIKVNEVLALVLDHADTHRRRSTNDLLIELDDLRRRHAKQRAVTRLLARTHAAAFRRWYLLKLAMSVAKFPGAAGWSGLIEATPRSSFSLATTIPALLPTFHARLSRRIIRSLPSKEVAPMTEAARSKVVFPG